ncbi:SHOCT domain-containing protein [Ensifer soli]|uniref:SHOCT domain-containing protein n=1 Tax=Ciceribacter sp. sgz301302 TaxID=3342379 RepID=UPI0035B84EB7
MVAYGARPAASRLLTGIVALGACLALSACTSSSLDDAAPVAATPAAYPSVYTPLQGATAQMTDAEAQSMEARLSRLSSARASGAISVAEYERRRRELEALADNHGADTLREITN